MNIPLVVFGVIEPGNDCVFGWLDGYPFHFSASYWRWGFEVMEADDRRELRSDGSLPPPKWYDAGDLDKPFIDLTGAEMREIVFRCAAEFSSYMEWKEPEPMDLMACVANGRVWFIEF